MEGRRWFRSVPVVAFGLVLLGCGVVREPDPTPPSADPELARRAVHTATELNDGTALIVGGCDVDGCSDATASVALLAADGARSLTPLPAPRDAHTAVLLDDGRVLVAGGFTGEGQPPLVTTDLFEPGANRWQSGPTLRTGRGGHAAARLGDGRVLIAGGWVASQTYASDTEIYDPRLDRFVSGPKIPAGADSLAATSLSDGRVLLTGGQISAEVATDAALLINPDGTARRVAGGLRTPRFKHAAVELRTGQVLIIGGTIDDRRILTSTELFDPETETLVEGRPLRSGRYKLSDAAVVLPDGRVVVAGSGQGVEVIDVASRTSTVAAGLADVSGSFSTASVVGDQVWVLGGYDRQIRMTSTDRRVLIADL